MDARRLFSGARRRLTKRDEELMAKLEAVVQRDEGGRGIAAFIEPGALGRAVEAILAAEPRKVLVFSGFPCCMDFPEQPAETDGPLGAAAIAYGISTLYP